MPKMQRPSIQAAQCYECVSEGAVVTRLITRITEGRKREVYFLEERGCTRREGHLTYLGFVRSVKRAQNENAGTP